MNARLTWPIAFGLLLIGGVGGVVATRTQTGKPGEPAPESGTAPQDSTTEAALLAARTKGSPEAPITVLEIVDFQCPACRMFWEETMPILQREYVQTGKVRFVFVNLPLVQIHRNAAAAHEFAMCAAAQDRFWPVHDMLFDQQSVWAQLDDPSAYFFSVATATGLITDSVDACVTDGRMRDLIMREAQGVVQAGVQSTPSFVIERGLMAGAVPIDGWRPILDSIYETKAGR
ncbi:MAG: DsbA family protein [Gemmatimonadota bacterium]|nr:DsbA family protein [Gemmatimonadota bacterium]MDH4351421.1 DsbA family protein [Gemmatimonadota bacterium]MDH5198343.1 DsbA family protein [Gemmatimonadota bacterium]